MTCPDPTAEFEARVRAMAARQEIAHEIVSMLFGDNDTTTRTGHLKGTRDRDSARRAAARRLQGKGARPNA